MKILLTDKPYHGYFYQKVYTVQGNEDQVLLSVLKDILRHDADVDINMQTEAECKRISDKIRVLRISHLVLHDDVYNIAINTIRNLQRIKRGVAQLKGRFTATPAIIVSAGPSLDKNIDQISKFADKAVIISAAQTMAAISEHGVKPDFVTSIDWQHLNTIHFKTINGDRLVCSAAIPGECLDGFKEVYFSSPLFTYRKGTVFDIVHQCGRLEKGGSVAHASFDLALQMGCDPIIMVGQDFAIGAHTHARGVDGYMPKGELMDTPGWGGGTVQTKPSFYTYCVILENMIDRCDRTVINCTEGGARIEGTEEKKLKECLKFLDGSVDKNIRVNELDTKLTKPAASQGVRAVNKIIKSNNIKSIGKLCRKYPLINSIHTGLHLKYDSKVAIRKLKEYLAGIKNALIDVRRKLK